MTRTDLDDYLETLRAAGWVVKTKPTDMLDLPPKVLERYPSIPEAYLDFLRHVEQCVNPAQSAWWFTESAFNGDENDNTTFRWNFYEWMSLDAASDDEEWAARIRAFWDRFIPIAYAVHSDYAYLAISLAPNSYGAIFYGYGCDFEDSAHQICGSYEEYVERHKRIVAGEESSEYPGPNGEVFTKREFWDFL